MHGVAGFGSVVRRYDEDGVVQFPARGDVIHQPPDMMIHRLDHAGVDFHRAGVLGPIVGLER